MSSPLNPLSKQLLHRSIRGQAVVAAAEWMLGAPIIPRTPKPEPLEPPKPWQPALRVLCECPASVVRVIVSHFLHAQVVPRTSRLPASAL